MHLNDKENTEEKTTTVSKRITQHSHHEAYITTKTISTLNSFPSAKHVKHDFYNANMCAVSLS